MFKNIAALLLSIVFAIGCGEGPTGGVEEVIALNPAAAAVPVSTTLELEVLMLETLANQIEWSVVGSDAGTIVPSNQTPPRTAVYTAPASPGTYRVRARCTTNTSTKTVESVLTVTP